MEEIVLGIDIGGTKIAVSLVTSKGQVLGCKRIPSGEDIPYRTALEQVLLAAKELVTQAGYSLQNLCSCGLSAPGALDIPNGVLLRCSNVGWLNVPVGRDLANGLGVPVAMENDANGAVLAEMYFGCAVGCKDVVYLTMSTGIGGGVVSNGHLVSGHIGLGGELGHIMLDFNGPLCGCGLHGCLEAYCGGRSVAQRLQECLKGHPEHPMFRVPGVDGKLENLNFQALREGARLGIPLAVDWWNEICLRLAQGIGIINAAYNPELVVLGTAAYYAGDFLLNPVLDNLPRVTWKEYRDCCRVVITALGPRIGELAGAAIALHNLNI